MLKYGGRLQHSAFAYAALIMHPQASNLSSSLRTMRLSTASKTQLQSSDERSIFAPKKVIILTKLTRMEFERRTHATLNEEQLKYMLARRGSDYSRLLERHEQHHLYLNIVEQELRNAGIETRVVQRFDYDKAAVEWADAVFSAGGDGTFLLAASRVTSSDKPIIGINTDPHGSEGYLCLLRKRSHEHFKDALKRLLDGDFRWTYRQRIRVRLRGDPGRIEHVELHDQQLNIRSSDAWHGMLSERRSGEQNDGSAEELKDTNGEVTLQELALNEVFMGESLSSRVSYYELQVDDGETMKQKSSGITVCTGTGSTSWFFNINKLNDQCVSDLLRIIGEELSVPMPYDDKQVVRHICNAFNNRLIFAPDLEKMAFSIRDPIYNLTFRPCVDRGFASKIRVRSRCFDAHLVIDGGAAYKFNDGAEAILEVHPEDALKTVIFR
uniref:NAD kinase 2, mitochondrial n=1 Tax=Parascaris univalens TaxID=6257 RepID=A0A915BU41_PARUN